MGETGHQVNLLYDWLTDCDKENIILCFKGDFNQDLVNAIVMLTENEPDIKTGSAVIRTRVFSVLVECMQNIRKYGAELSSGGDLKPGIVIVTFKDKTYTVSTGNFVNTEEVAPLRQRLDHLKTIDKKELKTLHTKVLTETQLSEKSGAGLGLISIARKSDEVQYNFRDLAGGKVFFSLSARISDNK